MKKILVLLLGILFFMPFVVKAEDLEIVSLEFDSKSDDAESLSDPTFNGLSVNLDVQFHTINDFVKYKIVLKNNSDKDYDVSSKQHLSDYVEVKFEAIGDNELILPAKSSMELYFVVSYFNEVPVSSFESGNTYVTEETKNIEFAIKEGKVAVEQKNPKTSTLFPKVLIPIIVLLGVAVFLFIKKERSAKGIVAIMIVAMVVIPVVSKAIEHISLDVKAKISIKHPSFYLTKGNETREYLFRRGSTWAEFLESPYNIGNWTTTEYYSVSHIGENEYGEEIGDRYHYFDDNKVGVSTGIQRWACNWYVSLDSYEEIANVYVEDHIINGHHYRVGGSAC